MDKLEAMTRQSRWDTHRWWDFAFAAATIVIAIMVDSLANGSAKHHATIALAVLAISWIFLGRKPVVETLKVDEYALSLAATQKKSKQKNE